MAGSVAVPWQPETVSGVIAEDTPPRDMAMASISSMKPIAPPSLRAALRSALK